MIRNIITFISLLVITSCNSDKNKISELELKTKRQKIIIDSLTGYNEKITKHIKSYKEKVKLDFVEKKHISLLLKDNLKFLIDKKELIKYIFDDFELKENDIDRALYRSYYFYPENYLSDYNSVHEFCKYIISKIDRSPKALNKIITPEVKEMIYSLLKRNNIYKDSGADAMVKALLLVYEDLKGDNEILSQIYESASNNDYDVVKQIILERNLESLNLVINDENYTSYTNDIQSTLESRLYIVYTFLARRYKEGNLEFTYSLLKELDENASNETLTTETTLSK